MLGSSKFGPTKAPTIGQQKSRMIVAYASQQLSQPELPQQPCTAPWDSAEPAPTVLPNLRCTGSFHIDMQKPIQKVHLFCLRTIPHLVSRPDDQTQQLPKKKALPRNVEAHCDIRPPTTCSQGLAAPMENYVFYVWNWAPANLERVCKISYIMKPKTKAVSSTMGPLTSKDELNWRTQGPDTGLKCLTRFWV